MTAIKQAIEAAANVNKAINPIGRTAIGIDQNLSKKSPSKYGVIRIASKQTTAIPPDMCNVLVIDFCITTHTWARVYERPADACGGVMVWLVIALHLLKQLGIY